MDELLGLYLGTVVDRADPERLGRVRVMIPGVVEPDSAWALPVGTLGGGSAQRGGFFVPEKGADVAVAFIQGDIDRPVYWGGHWGKPGGTSEVPSYLAAVTSATDAPNVRAIETKNYLLVFDDRSGSENLLVKEKQGNAFVRFTNNKIELGGAATEAAVLGDVLKSKLEAIIDQIKLITVPTGVGPSGFPANAAAFETIKGTLGTTLSSIVKVK